MPPVAQSRVSRRLLPLLALLLAAPLAARPTWPKVQSDLPPDPSLVEGTLPNGLRYAILPNPEPRDCISLRLLVAVGSLYEQDNEQGLAHFVEHMLYHGTRQHPGDSLSQLLETRGIGYGPDSNAFTGYRSTIYHLELPDARPETLRLGLEAFREFAGDALFTPRYIPSTRGVIDNEGASRLTPSYLLQLNNLAFLWPASRQSRRAPIGLDRVIRHCTANQLAHFYNTWYRPERMAVIVVGDVTPGEVEPLVRELFSSLRDRAPAQPVPDTFAPAQASPPNVRVLRDFRQPGASFLFEHPFPAPHVPDTHAHRVRLFHLAMALSMLKDRLEKFSHDHDHTFVAPFVSVNDPVMGWQVVTVGGNSDLAYWARAIADLEKEHRRAYLYGFTAEELHVAQAAYASAYRQAARSAGSRASSALADQLATCLLDGNAFSTPAAVEQDVEPIIADTTTADCLAAFRAVWSMAPPHVFVVANRHFSCGPSDVADVLNDSRKINVTPPRVEAAAAFAYTDFGPPGRIVVDEPVSDLELHLARFANGVRLNFKHTTFDADLVDVCVRVGDGKLSQPRDEPGLDLLADQLVIPGGLGRHTAQQINDLMAGRSLSVNFQVGTDACYFNGRCSRHDLTLCLQLVTAYLTDPAFRTDTLTDARAAFGTMYTTLAASPGGPITEHAPTIMAGGDARFGIPAPATLEARNLDEVKRWINPQFKRGRIEVTVVGDVTWAEASAAVATTLGTLNARPFPIGDSPAAAAAPPAVKKARHLYLTLPTLQQGAIAWAWPAPGILDAHKERRYAVLTQAMTERLRTRIREQLGAAYSPAASFVEFDGFPELGYLIAYVEIPPARVNQVMRLVNREIARLASRRLGKAEFQRIKEPVLAARAQDLRTNVYWTYTVLRDAQEHPGRLAAARDRQADYSAITRDQIEALAHHVLAPDRCVIFMAGPAVASRASAH